MPYQQTASRQDKALIIFLLDQSYSMEESIVGSDQRKMDCLATLVNHWLQNVVIRATSSAGVRDLLDVAVVGYRTDMEANPIIESALSRAPASRFLVAVKEIGEAPARIEQRMQQFYDDESGQIMETPVEVPVWIEAKAEGGTPTCSALYKAYEIVEQWIGEHSRSFPPVIIHITDGESQEGDPLPYAEPLRSLETEDGNVLLFNCHLAMPQIDPDVFPNRREALPNAFAKQLFDMSSVLPERAFALAMAKGYSLQPGARGVAFNADIVTGIKFIDIATAALQLEY